ncbi:hypothetical protein AMJ86_04090 [bacterium SM23_57]|jgi:hypothetical protein|nr:MAG: hypothetical protein AMJ86_04090 [bacterium SM23_57]
MEEIEITVRFDTEGNILPLNFVWRMHTYKVAAIGRYWDAADGRHILVMDPRNQTHHLIFKTETLKWYLFQSGNRSDTSLA